MNANMIINMVIRMLMRHGISAAMRMFQKRRAAPPQARPQQQPMSREERAEFEEFKRQKNAKRPNTIERM
jgi:hypothetical protein